MLCIHLVKLATDEFINWSYKHWAHFKANHATDNSTVENLSSLCCWDKNGLPEEIPIEIIHLHEANANGISSAIIECLKQKKHKVSKTVSMGFDRAKEFSGTKTGVQVQIKELAPHTLFVNKHVCVFKLLCSLT